MARPKKTKTEAVAKAAPQKRGRKPKAQPTAEDFAPPLSETMSAPEEAEVPRCEVAQAIAAEREAQF